MENSLSLALVITKSATRRDTKGVNGLSSSTGVGCEVAGSLGTSWSDDLLFDVVFSETLRSTRVSRLSAERNYFLIQRPKLISKICAAAKSKQYGILMGRKWNESDMRVGGMGVCKNQCS
jgi:hypothetical protein